MVELWESAVRATHSFLDEAAIAALRPAVVVLLAMLASKGTSVLRSTYVIHRGYEDLADRLNELGASIETFYDHQV